MNDTGWAARTVTAVLLSLALFGRACAEPSPLPAKVVWANAGRVYIASKDTLALEAGDLLTFYSGRKILASGTVTAVHDGALAVVLLASGSLDRVKKPERLRILSERARMSALRVFRLGWPSVDRSNLLFRCGLAPRPYTTGLYRAEALDSRSYQLVRESSGDIRAPWPDTLLVRLFDEAADQEIALERGELDAAIFWPGELSTHMRESPRWRDPLLGIRSRGVLAALMPPDRTASIARDSSAVASLNDELFRGDLAPWIPPFGLAQFPDSVWSVRSDTPRWFQVDHACPGWQTMEHSLNRERPQGPDMWGTVRVTYLDALIDSPDSLASAGADLVTRADLPSDLREGAEQRVKFLFAIRCPVVCAPPLRPYVRALGADALVDMLECRRTSGKP